MAITIGNYTGQPGGRYPVDTGTLDSIQGNIIALMTLGSIGGTNIIVSGCDINSAGNARDAGWLYLTTRQYPSGELIYFVGGSVADGLYISEETIQVTAEGVTYDAYKVRSARPGLGGEHYEWSAINTIKTNRQLEAMITAAVAAAVPVGTIRLFGGPMSKVPAGWLACDGSTYKISDYPALYNVIGKAYNANVPEDSFNLPNLAAYHPLHTNNAGKFGGTEGKKYITLTPAHLPKHEHQVHDYYYIESQSEGNAASGKASIGSDLYGSADSDGDNSVGYYYTHNTEPDIYDNTGNDAGLQKAIDITPPTIRITYIIKAQ